jgi:hypothetical protein
MRFLSLLLPVAIVSCGSTAAAQEVANAKGPAEAVDASTVNLPCVPVGAYWPEQPNPEAAPPTPDLAIVSIDVRPKDARVHLDGHFVGRARYFDGTPSYLFLEPGFYRLELRADGHRPVLVELTAERGCRYDLRHRLDRLRDLEVAHEDAEFGKGKPQQRVFAPTRPKPQQPAPESAGPDPSLRPDIGRGGPDVRVLSPPAAGLKLRVEPPSARVSIDGVFVATARELARMVGPLAMTPGPHRILVEAEGHHALDRGVELRGGEVLELDLALRPAP